MREAIVALAEDIDIKVQLRSQSLSNPSIIAIVDDDQAVREALEDLLVSYGYESRLFSSAEEYLSYEAPTAIDCVLVDVKMPGLSGIELQDVLNGQAHRPPMIFMTSFNDERTRSAAIQGGAFAFLGKPVDVAGLMSAVEKALGRNG